MTLTDGGKTMISTRTHRKKYVRFRWWQYGRWLAVIVIVTFCLGFAFGFSAGRLWSEMDKTKPPHSEQLPSL